jgi:hypothetical protein
MNYTSNIHLSKSSASNRAVGCSIPFFDPHIQAKLTIGQPNHIYEQEADAMADKVMRMKNDEPVQTFFKPAISRIQKKCAHCEDEEKLQMKSDGGGSKGMAAPAVVHDVINSGGQALDKETATFMESRFGYDFGDVRVHNDSLAHQSSKDINALAYTHGNHMVFGAGQYQPGTDAGKKLLAHELTHVIQQKSLTKIFQPYSGNTPTLNLTNNNSKIPINPSLINFTAQKKPDLINRRLSEPPLVSEGAGGCGICFGGDLREVGNSAHAQIQQDFHLMYPLLSPQFPIQIPPGKYIISK